jgi:uncharacterized membrane protein
MEDFLLFVVFVVLFIRWAILSRRYSKMEQRIDMLVHGRVEPHEITKLIKRITQLEDALAGLMRERAGVAVEAPPAPAPVQSAAPPPTPALAPGPPKPQPKLEPVAAPAPPPATVAAPEPPKTEPEPVAAQAPPLPPPPRPATPPAPAIPERARPSRSSEEWEAIVGGNLLNKLGILVLVIALALFLGYSFTQLGPAGRSAIALAISFALLIGGVVLDRRAPYVIFGRGLLAGGWAGLYFTTYAMQALDAAKVIHNPVLGASLLLAVATGMVVHSLRYRSQAVTGLAYLVAFATLAITQVTALSVIALIPLAGSLLVVAYRFEWKGMALFSLAATYATCASRGDNGAPLWSAQAVFAAYWLLFEVYDLLRIRRHSNHGAEQAMLPLNALAFAGLSYAKWSAAAPDHLYLLAAGGAAAYLASTILRAFLRPPASFPAEAGTLERIFAGGFEGPITLAAACSAAAAVLKLHGQTVNNVLLAEGELLFLAGLLFRQEYPRRLAGTLFAALGLKLLLTDIPGAGTVAVAGRTLRDWTPSAALAAVLFYVNRGLRKAALSSRLSSGLSSRLSSGLSYGYAASALIALIIGFEIPLRNMGIAWLGFGALLFVFGWRWRPFDFRIQGYLAGALSLCAIAVHQFKIADGSTAPSPHPWIPLALAAAVMYGAAICARRSPADRLTAAEREPLEFFASAVATAACVALLWKTVPAAYLGPAWMALALAVLELGLRRWPPDFRWHASLVVALGVARVLYLSVLPLHSITQTAERIAIGSAALLAYLFAARMFAASPGQVDRAESRRAVDVASACGSFFVLVELWALLDPVIVAPAWALFALLLIGIGFRTNLAALRLQGHVTAAAAFGRLFLCNFDAAGYSFGVSRRLLTVGVTIAAHYYESWRQQRKRERLDAWENSIDRPYLYTAAGLIAGLLFLELRAPFIEVGWAFLALALLVAGRSIDLPDLRFQSYALAALAFGRTLIVEFSSPHMFASTRERIATGAIVTACLFIAQLFIPRERPARLFYSLLSTVLATALLYREVSGSMLTVAWGIEGLVLLGAGFPLRDRTLRLSGLVLFLVCVGKLFLYDMRALETLYRILSFFVLGVILVGVSWIYTRFRVQVQRYL